MLTFLTAITGFFATDSGSPCCLNLYSFQLLVMLIFQLTVVGLIYTHKVSIPEDQKKSAEDSRFARFLQKQEKIAKVMALCILGLQVLCIMCACLLKGMKWKPKDEFEFDEDFQTSLERERKQPLLHFSDTGDTMTGSSSSRNKKNKKSIKKKNKKAKQWVSEKYADV